MNNDALFELVVSLPDAKLDLKTATLIGFDRRYAAIAKDVRLLLSPDELLVWSKRHHRRELELCALLADRYPLVVFHGDVGTGKTATAEGLATRLAREIGREAVLYRLSTRVRGSGLHGEMSKLISEAFDRVVQDIGKKRMGFLLIDEADALASSREIAQSHQEEKAGTNTLIQKIDDTRRHGGRLVVVLCTNRLEAVDPAVVRRAAHVIAFDRPDEGERRELLRRDLAELDLTDAQITRLVHATGPDAKSGRNLGLTFSDLRTRFLPAAVLRAFPDAPLSFDILLEAARATPASARFGG